MTSPRWLALRAAWALPTTDVHAARRARARRAYNRLRQDVAKARRRDLARFLTKCAALPTPPPLSWIYEDFQRQWICSRTTFFRDLRAIRAQWAEREAKRAAREAPLCTEGERRSTLPSAALEKAPAATPAAAPPKRRPRTHGGVWVRYVFALELALAAQAPPELAQRVRLHAAELFRELTAHADSVLGVLSVLQRLGAGTGSGTTLPTVPGVTVPGVTLPTTTQAWLATFIRSIRTPPSARTRTREALGLPPWGMPLARPRPDPAEWDVGDPWTPWT